MRITYLHQYFNTPLQAGGTRSYEFARRLVRRGHQVTMITSDRTGGGNGVHEESVEGMRVLRIPVAYDNAMGYPRRMAAFASFAARSARLAGSQECDVIYATSTPLTIALPAMHAAMRRRSPWVLEVRDLWPEIPVALGALPNPAMRMAANMLADHAYASAAHIVALSPGIARGIMARNVDSSKITIIPNGCDTDLFGGPHVDPRAFRAARPELGSRKIVLYAGTVGKVNGLEYLVAMASAAGESNRDISFVIVGSGGQESRVRDLAVRKGVLGKNLFMYPSVPKAEVANAVAAADLTLSLVSGDPALQDNCANKFFDSLAAGKPIAINHGGWLAEMIRQHGIGIVLPPNEPAAASDMVRSFVRNTPAVLASGEAASKLAHGRYARDSLFRVLEQVLLETVRA